MGTIDTLLRIKADASGAVSGLKPLQSSLQQTATDAQKTETALSALDGQHTISLNDQAIESARLEVERLRNLMREQLRIDPTADTRDAQKKITLLQRSIKTLDDQHPVVEVDVSADTTGLAGLQGILSEVSAGFVEGAGGGMLGRIASSSSALRLLGTGGVAAAAGVTAVGAAAAIAAKQAWDLGEAAADVETSISQLDALTKGRGTETFAQLQEFAATTPFELDEVTDATKRLVAAGVDLDQIPQQLTDIGNVAAATGVPIEQIATVFAQMESKGKLTFEETQQLAEAGIPVWQTLADKLGLTVAEVQKLATEGKLGAEAVDLLRVSLGEEFPTAMTDQAETFNGMMSTLNDTFAQMRAELGTLFLPLMKDVVGAIQDLADMASVAVGWLVDVDEWLTKISGRGIAETLLGAVPGIGPLINSLSDSEEENAKQAEEDKKKSDELAASIELVASSAAQAQQDLQDHADQLERLGENVQTTQERYDDLVDSFNTFHDGLIEGRDAVYDYQGAVDDLAESLLDDSTFSPDLEAGRTNWDNFTALAESASVRVVDTWRTKGADAAIALQKSFRKSAAKMLTDAGLTSDQAWKLVNQAFDKPFEVGVKIGEIDTAGLRKDLAKLRQERADIKTGITLPPADATGRDFDRYLAERGAALKPINAKIHAVVEKLHPEKDKLDELANPDGGPRTAKYNAHLDALSAATVKTSLDNLALDRTVIYHVQIAGLDMPVLPGQTIGPTAGPTAGPAGLRTAGAAVLDSPVATPASGWSGGVGIDAAFGRMLLGAQAPAPVPGQPVRIAPKQVPIAVYLDGVEIAHRIEARRSMAAVSSVRRSA